MSSGRTVTIRRFADVLSSLSERAVVTYHEMGHALVTLALPGTETVHKVSIIPRGIGALGYNIRRPTEDRYLMSAEELRNRMACLLGGRAAEILVFDEISTGAADDLDKATDIARGMVMRYGMDEGLGPVVYTPKQPLFLNGHSVPHIDNGAQYGEKTADAIDDAVRHLVADALAKASEILAGNRDFLDQTARKLLEKETLLADELPKPASLKRNAPLPRTLRPAHMS